MNTENNIRATIKNNVDTIFNTFIEVTHRVSDMHSSQGSHSVKLHLSRNHAKTPTHEEIDRARALYNDLVMQCTEMTDEELEYAEEKIIRTKAFDESPFKLELKRRGIEDVIIP